MTADEISNLFEGIMAQADAGEGVTVYSDYSGRFMYGRDCFAIYTRNRYQGDSIQEYMREHDLSCGRCDSMGMGVVIYWPELTRDLLTDCDRERWDRYKADRDRREAFYPDDEEEE